MAQIDQMLPMIQQADNLLAQLDPNIDLNSPTWQAIKQLLARLALPCLKCRQSAICGNS